MQSVDDLEKEIAKLKSENAQLMKQVNNDNNDNNKNVFDELRSQVNKLNEKIKNGPKNSSYSLSLLIDINKVEQDAKAQQQQFEVYTFMFWDIAAVFLHTNIGHFVFKTRFILAIKIFGFIC